ncbi:carbohydrate-binding module family 18 protein [Gigaspora margarita]|uniref:Carbohydrate-binding module family 18 protein n=1 Tax=Gigaspora margarita TaxID=4874 RepID=A0A8H4ET76_GIGMA|nr:carbohydrate-binding module family 18 protein [Gigaspora margarita]
MNRKFNGYIIFSLFKIISCLALPQSSTIARCGKDFGGIKCPNNSDGSCCSQYGYCGNSEEHCSPSHNCQSGCSNLSSSNTNNSSGENANTSDLLYKILVPVFFLFVILLVYFSLSNQILRERLRQLRDEFNVFRFYYFGRNNPNNPNNPVN